MAKKNRKSDRSAEGILRQRVRVMVVIFLLFAGVAIYQMIYLQVYNGTYYQDMALKLQQQSVEINPTRGRIYDSKGVVLAQTGEAHTVVAYPEMIKARYLDETAERLANTLGLKASDIRRKLASSAKSVTIKRQVSDDEAQSVMDLGLIGVSLSVEKRRNYPLDTLAAPLLGYTDYDGEGRMGLELDYNTNLAGEAGRVVGTKTRSGKDLPYGDQQYIAATDGSDIKLTVDVVAQNTASESLQEIIEATNAKRASALAMNIKTGEILVMASEPTSNLNSLDRKHMDQTRALLRNSTVADTFYPGMNFSLFTAAAALATGEVTLDSSYDCTGYLQLDGENVYVGESHGTETLAEALQRQCPTVIGQVALNMDSDKLYSLLETIGFGQTTNVGLNSEAAGTVPSLKYMNQALLVALGQGESIAVTPIQFASALSTVFGGGKRMQPYVINEISQPGVGGGLLEKNSPTQIGEIMSQTAADSLIPIYENNVKAENANGANLYIPGYRVGGSVAIAKKTSTNLAKEENVYYVNAFSFAPADDPTYLVLVVVDSPEVSSMSFGKQLAAPAARALLHNVLKQKHISANYEATGDSGVTVDIAVPSVVGQTLENAQQTMYDLGLRVTANGTGSVVAQIPKEGTRVPSKTGVLLFMSETSEISLDELSSVAIPNVTGMTLRQAYAELNRWGLEVDVMGDRMGVVTEQLPMAGSRVDPNDVSQNRVMLTLKAKVEE